MERGKEPFAAAHEVAKGVETKSLLNRLKEIAWEHAGIVRTDEGIKAGLRDLTNIQGMIKEAEPGGLSDIRDLEDLKSMVFTLQSIFMVSLLRRESRGAFIRADFPKMDDMNWRKNSCIVYDPEEEVITVEFHKPR